MLLSSNLLEIALLSRRQTEDATASPLLKPPTPSAGPKGALPLWKPHLRPDARVDPARPPAGPCGCRCPPPLRLRSLSLAAPARGLRPTASTPCEAANGGCALPLRHDGDRVQGAEPAPARSPPERAVGTGLAGVTHMARPSPSGANRPPSGSACVGFATYGQHPRSRLWRLPARSAPASWGRSDRAGKRQSWAGFCMVPAPHSRDPRNLTSPPGGIIRVAGCWTAPQHNHASVHRR
jgi:hypothetical protein